MPKAKSKIAKKLVKSVFSPINDKIDAEHQEILDNLDAFYNSCKKHWKTENKLFKEGLKKLPHDHDAVKCELDEHKQHHIDVLNAIAQMKIDIIDHINEHDAIHLHWI